MNRLWVLATLIALAGAALAEPPQKEEEPRIPLVAHLDIYQISDATAEKLRGKRTVDRGFRGERLLNSAELVIVVGRDALLHVGHKSPIIYRDPKRDQFQVQYVDIGLKLDIVARNASGNLLDVDIRPEYSVRLDTLKGTTDPADPRSYPKTSVFTTNTTFRGISLDTNFILGLQRGRAVQDHLASLGLAGGTPNLMYLLRLEKL